MLIFSLEKEHKPPCQDSVEVPVKQPRLLGGFADYWRAGQIALKRRNKGRCCIYAEDIESFVD